MISIIIGSTTEITRKQIAYIQAKINGDNMLYKDIMLYNPLEDQFGNITEKEFMHGLARSDVLIMSGGETAYTLLYSSGFSYLLSRNQIMPLISTGIIIGGLFHEKNYIIKGGSIGDASIYDSLIKYARNNFLNE
jgi:uncharacterized protein YgbK (DUF1537 family)